MFEKIMLFVFFFILLSGILLFSFLKRKNAKNFSQVQTAVKIPESYDVYVLSLNEKVKFLMISCFCMGIAAYVFYSQIVLSILFSSLSLFGLKPYSQFLAQKRKRELNEQFRDALYSISSSVSAGRQLPEAIKEASENLRLIYSENDYIILEFSYMVKRIFDSNESAEVILSDFAQRTGIEDIRNFADIYIICRKTGGDFESVIMKTANMLIEKINIMREIKIITAQKKFEAKILALIPFVVILFLQLISPEYLKVMYSTISGRLIMTMGLLGIIGSYFWSMKITNIEV